MDLLDPQEFVLDCYDGKQRTYVLSKFPAIAGREILAKYSVTALPKIGDYGANEETMLKLMSFVAVKTSKDVTTRLVTPVLVDNHVRSPLDLMKLEDQMFKYNYGFFLQEKALDFFNAFLKMAQERLREMLTGSLQQSSTPAKPLI